MELGVRLFEKNRFAIKEGKKTLVLIVNVVYYIFLCLFIFYIHV